jgi:hypothetical protein
MEKYTLTINCEFINEAGILVNHTLKADASVKPRIEDKYMFISKHHFKPIVIRIQQVIDYLLSGTEVICSGEEVDELDNIREVFYARFTIE